MIVVFLSVDFFTVVFDWNGIGGGEREKHIVDFSSVVVVMPHFWHRIPTIRRFFLSSVWCCCCCLMFRHMTRAHCVCWKRGLWLHIVFSVVCIEYLFLFICVSSILLYMLSSSSSAYNWTPFTKITNQMCGINVFSLCLMKRTQILFIFIDGFGMPSMSMGMISGFQFFPPMIENIQITFDAFEYPNRNWIFFIRIGLRWKNGFSIEYIWMRVEQFKRSFMIQSHDDFELIPHPE